MQSYHHPDEPRSAFSWHAATSALPRPAASVGRAGRHRSKEFHAPSLSG
jgi:hypothetical protein